MKPKIALTLCKMIGHPGLRQLARDVRESGRESALLFRTCPRCGLEIFSIEVKPLPKHRHSNRPAPA
jgi:hypothetical protein